MKRPENLATYPFMGIDISSLNNRQLNMIDKKERIVFGKAGVTTEEATEKALDLLEGRIEDLIAGYLGVRGVQWVVRQRRDKRTRTKKGTVDMMFAYRGIPCAWEVKRPGQELRKDQEDCREKMIADGWRHETVRSVEEAKRILDAL